MMSSILMRTPRMFSPLSTPSFATDCHAAYVLDTLRHVDDDVWASTLRCIAPDLACVIGIPVVLLNENMSTSFDIRVGTAPSLVYVSAQLMAEWQPFTEKPVVLVWRQGHVRLI